MRITSWAAGLAVAVVACGGDKNAGEQQTTTTPPPAEQPASGAAAPAAGGTTHEVKMVLEGSAYKYVPDQLTIAAGDVVRFVSVSGGGHNTQFYPDSVPANLPPALQALTGAPPEKGGSIVMESMKVEGESFDVSFANAPAGRYKYFCAPHHALGMVGEITVQ